MRLTLLLCQTRRFLKNSFPTGLSLNHVNPGETKPGFKMGRVSEQEVAQKIAMVSNSLKQRQTHLFGFLVKFSKAVIILFVGFNSLLITGSFIPDLITNMNPQTTSYDIWVTEWPTMDLNGLNKSQSSTRPHGRQVKGQRCKESP